MLLSAAPRLVYLPHGSGAEFKIEFLEHPLLTHYRTPFGFCNKFYLISRAIWHTIFENPHKKVLFSKTNSH
jgi:hypothetical protein